jgi:hypothetical protein
VCLQLAYRYRHTFRVWALSDFRRPRPAIAWCDANGGKANGGRLRVNRQAGGLRTHAPPWGRADENCWGRYGLVPTDAWCGPSRSSRSASLQVLRCQGASPFNRAATSKHPVRVTDGLGNSRALGLHSPR